MCRYQPDGQVFSDALCNQPVSTPDAAARHAGASFDAGSREGRCRQQQTPMQHAANADAGCCVFKLYKMVSMMRGRKCELLIS